MTFVRSSATGFGRLIKELLKKKKKNKKKFSNQWKSLKKFNCDKFK